MSDDDHVAAARAVYDASAERYVEFVGREISAATETALDRAVLASFVEMIAAEPGQVADVGCGPGRVAAYLAGHDLDVIGVDVSPAMVAHAGRAHPGIRFGEGRLDELPMPDRSLAAVVCWYSIIYTPPDRLGTAFTELLRVLRPGGLLLLAFQAGQGEAVHRADAHGSGLPLTSIRHEVADVVRRLEEVAFEVRATVQREPELEHESTSQAFLIARSSERGGH